MKKIVSPELMAAIFTGMILALGYFYTANKEQDLEEYKIKTAAYSDFLNNITSLITTTDPSKIDFDKENRALLNLYMYAPDCVVKKLGSVISFSPNGVPYISGAEALEKYALILHEDVWGSLVCGPRLVFGHVEKDKPLEKGDLPVFIGAASN